MKSLSKYIFNEGTTNRRDDEKWEEALELLGAEEFVNILYKYLSADQISDIIGWLEQDGYFD